MALTDFFTINLPYGMLKNESDEWVIFNREFKPLGWNSSAKTENIEDPSEAFAAQYPIFTKYKGVTEDALLKIIKNQMTVVRGDDNKIFKIIFYDDGTNPQSHPECWNDYFDIIRQFSKFEKRDQ